MRLLVGIDPDDFAGHERLIAAFQEDRKFDGEASVHDPRHARADIQLLVEPDRRLVFND